MNPVRYLSIPSRLRTRIGGEKERESVSVEVGAGEVCPGSGGQGVPTKSGCSRNTVRCWLRRYEEAGLKGLKERSPDLSREYPIRPRPIRRGRLSRPGSPDSVERGLQRAWGLPGQGHALSELF